MLKSRKASMAFLISAWVALITPVSEAQDTRTLGDQIPKPVETGAARAVGRYPGSARMDVAIGLPLGDREGLKTYIDTLYDPASPNYKRYLTPDQFTARFGASAADYQKVVDFARCERFNGRRDHPQPHDRGCDWFRLRL